MMEKPPPPPPLVWGSPSQPGAGHKLTAMNIRYLATVGAALSLVLLTTLLVSVVSELHVLRADMAAAFVELSERFQENKFAGESQLKKLSSTLSTETARLAKSNEKAQEHIEAINKKLKLSETKSRVTQTTRPEGAECDIGVATVLAKRIYNGTEVEYWQGLFNTFPQEIGVVAVLNRLGRPIAHPVITNLLHPQSEEPFDFDEDVIMRPLKQNFDDPLDRVKWRSKIVLDFVRVVRFVADRCKYVLWMEDDATAPDEWLKTVRDLTHRNVAMWAIIYLANGMPAVLINTRYVDYILQYLTHHFDEQPVDWLLANAVEEIKKKYPQYNMRHPPRTLKIFGHRGNVSSLSNADLRPVY